MLLFKVVVNILREIKKKALNQIALVENLKGLTAEDCHWVLTVPAIWEEADKQFMRTAAVSAGIIKDFHSTDMVLALEPECAAIRLHTLKGLQHHEGQKLLTIDCGGGTVDFCAIQVCFGSDETYRFRQIYEPTGGNWGSTYIDDNFYKLMKKLLGKDAFHQGMLSSVAHNDVHANWEALKLCLRAINFIDGNKGVSFNLKNLLLETKQSLTKLVGKYNSVHKDPLQIRKKHLLGSTNKLILSPKILRKIFDPIIRQIVQHTKMLLAKPEFSDLEHIILVGGFGQSEYLRYQLKRTLKLKPGVIIVPRESSSVVMTGAVNFGLQPSVIESRKAALSVGLKSTIPFDKAKHTSVEALNHRKYLKHSNTAVLKNKFVPFVRRGEEVGVNEERSQEFNSAPGMTSIKFHIYASRRADIEFVDEENCVRLGTIIIGVDPKLPPQTFTCKLRVGFTELFATVVNEKTREESKIRVEYNRVGKNVVVLDEATPTLE